jgi:SAM-dependent methyltransferase
MTTDEAGVYADAKFRDIDIGAIMRKGHPDIEAGDEHIVETVKRLRYELNRPLKVLDVGSGSGHLSWLLAQELADGEIVANEISPNPIAQARAKLAPFRHSRIFDRSFDDWNEPVDVIISWGSHHHLSHSYLTQVARLLNPGGVLIVGDEMCPEYLTPADQQRLRAATTIEIVDGYIFDSPADIRAYRESGVAPEWNLRLERARQRALWEWYKFVGDFAVEREEWMVLITELQIARDDLITDFAEEHKTSPFLLQRELELNRFTILERHAVGGADRPASLQSFVIYTCRPEDGAGR